jgi:type IV pilus assembly protein PilM
MNSLFKKKAKSIIGLDIGTRYIKAICLDKTEDSVKVTGFACESITGNAFNEREIKDFDAVSRALKKVKLSLKNKQKTVAIAVAGPSVISKTVYMDPNQTDFELESQIEIEADSLIPYPIDEVYLDFEEIRESAAHVGKVEVLLTAAHKELVDNRITLVREVPFEPKVVDIETYALANAVRYFSDAEEGETQCCMSVGSSMLQLCFVKDGLVTYSKDYPFGMNKFVQDLSVIHSLDIQEIEEQLALGTAPEAWFNDTLPLFISALQQQIQRALQMYSSSTHELQPSKILLAGGAAVLPSIAEELSKDLGIEIQSFNPLLRASISDKLNAEELIKLSPQLAIAIGLASRGFNEWHM